MHNVRVVRRSKTDAGKFLIDNTKLRSPLPRYPFYNTPNLQDLADHPGVPWSKVVRGDLQNGCLAVNMRSAKRLPAADDSTPSAEHAAPAGSARPVARAASERTRPPAAKRLTSRHALRKSTIAPPFCVNILFKDGGVSAHLLRLCMYVYTRQ